MTLEEKLRDLTDRLDLDTIVEEDWGVEALVHELAHVAVMRNMPPRLPGRLDLTSQSYLRPGWRRFPAWVVDNRVNHSRHKVQDELRTIATTIVVLHVAGLLRSAEMVAEDSCRAQWGVGRTTYQRKRQALRMVFELDTQAAAACTIAMISRLHRRPRIQMPGRPQKLDLRPSAADLKAPQLKDQ